MQLFPRLSKGSKSVYWVILTAMIGIAFFQGFRTTHDLHWAYDTDFDRDMAFVRGTLDGEFGKDPNYRGEFLWYNPLLFSIESQIVKITGLPINVVLARAGVYLNALAPVFFSLMLLLLFGPEISLAGTCCFLFFASGDIAGYGAATYSPWLFPVCFVQFLFYLNIIFLYLALKRQQYRWFILLGIFTGASFLGHMGPTLIIVLMTVSLMAREAWILLRSRDSRAFTRLALQSLSIVVPFLLIASPLLFFVLGKYQLQTVNQSPANFNSGPFDLRYPLGMLKANFSFSLLIAGVGVWWFYRKFHQLLLARRLVMAWTGAALLLYLYTSLIKVLADSYNITLPGTVPAFHYYFYLKSVESVYFAFGWVYLLERPITWMYTRLARAVPRPTRYYGYFGIFAIALLGAALLYFPVYSTRKDFVELRKNALIKESNHDKIGVYYYLVEHIPSSAVILSEAGESIFPVMASARKMVAIETTFSNPFVSYVERNNDRAEMFASLRRGEPEKVKRLFAKYQVKYILLPARDGISLQKTNRLPGKVIYENAGYMLICLDREGVVGG